MVRSTKATNSFSLSIFGESSIYQNKRHLHMGSLFSGILYVKHIWSYLVNNQALNPWKQLVLFIENVDLARRPGLPLRSPQFCWWDKFYNGSSVRPNLLCLFIIYDSLS